MNNLLTDQPIRIDISTGSPAEASLPEIFALLMRDVVESFPALRPHQRHSWHAFLVQLGAMAIDRAGLSEPPEDASDWLRLIQDLTSDWPDGDPWSLVVEDITEPAFMQPPASSADKISDYRNTVETPDALDILITSKNHDLKSSVALSGKADDWIFALITLQTMEGYSGSSNYGISRMPSGYGNRPAFSITPSHRHGAHVRRDIIALLEYRESLLDDYPMVDPGIGLVWILPWDGAAAEAVLLNALDPFYIEVCRRVRLRQTADAFEAICANSKSKRIVDAKGLTGDPWAPTSNKTNPQGTPTSFLGPRGFGYDRVIDGLTSADWRRPYLLNPLAAEQGAASGMQLVARGIVRGQGGTQGYHERVIPLRTKVVRAFGRPGGIKEIGEIARDRIKQIAVLLRILRHAVWTFAAGGKTQDVSEEARALARPWANKLNELVDATFFDDLQEEFAVDDPGGRQTVRDQWLRGVIADGRRILRDAEESLPCPAIRRYRARVRADSVFEGRIRGNNGFPQLFVREEATSDNGNA